LILSACAESIILSAPPSESMTLLSACTDTLSARSEQHAKGNNNDEYAEGDNNDKPLSVDDDNKYAKWGQLTTSETLVCLIITIQL
jgi:hypothetical protein